MSQTTNTRNTLRHCVDDLGWHFLPVYGGTWPERAKRPVRHEMPRWSIGSTNDRDRLEDWHRKGYGLAVDCRRSGIVVLDADRPGDIAPALRLELGRTGWVISGNPERRSYIFDAADIGCGTWAAGEVKGAGGYAVVPPSWHAIGGAYRWLSTAGSRVMPAMVRDMLTASAARPPAGPVAGLTDGEPCAFVARFLAEGLRRLRDARPPRGNEPGERNGVMTRTRYGLCCRSAEGHSGVAGAMDVLRGAYAVANPDDAGLFDAGLAAAVRAAVPDAGAWCRDPGCGLSKIRAA